MVINSIDYGKDVDCFHPFNMGRLTLGEPTFPPATPAACMELLERHLKAEGKDVTDALEGAEVCVVGHSNTVGKPLALLLLNRNATTTVSHVFTSNRATWPSTPAWPTSWSSPPACRISSGRTW